MTPESVGWSKSSLVMGKHSGRAAFRDKLRALGYGEVGDNTLNDAFRRFKDLADRKKSVYDEDIMALIDVEGGRGDERVRFVSLDLHAGSKSPPAGRLGAGDRRNGPGSRGNRGWPGGRDVPRYPDAVPA